MRWFFEGYSTQEDFENVLTQPLERGILRSPELVLNGTALNFSHLMQDIIPSLCSALRPEIDLSQAVSKNLLPQLISSLTSTNVIIREASHRATTELMARCHISTALLSIANILIKTLKDGTIKAV